jgi:hypothetical protein
MATRWLQCHGEPLQELRESGQFTKQQRETFMAIVLEAAVRARAEAMSPDVFLDFCGDAIKHVYGTHRQRGGP